MSTIQQQIEARKQEAKDKRISAKAYEILRVLGIHSPETAVPGGGHASTNSYSHGELRIITSHYSSSEWGGSSLEIQHRKERVFGGSGETVEVYIPGPWTDELEALYQRVPEEEKRIAAAAAQKREAEQAAALAAEAKKFGL